MIIDIQTIAQHANIMVREAKAEEIRKDHYNTIVLFKVGEYYETYGKGATEMARATGLTLTYIGNIQTAAFPIRKKDTYFPRLVYKGYKVCIIED